MIYESFIIVLFTLHVFLWICTSIVCIFYNIGRRNAEHWVGVFIGCFFFWPYPLWKILIKKS